MKPLFGNDLKIKYDYLQLRECIISKNSKQLNPECIRKPISMSIPTYFLEAFSTGGQLRLLSQKRNVLEKNAYNHWWGHCPYGTATAAVSVPETESVLITPNEYGY